MHSKAKTQEGRKVAVNCFFRLIFLFFISTNCLIASSQTSSIKTGPQGSGKKGANTATQISKLTLDQLTTSPDEWRLVDWSKPAVLEDSKWGRKTNPEIRPDGIALTHEKEGAAFGIPGFKQYRWRTTNTDSDVLLSMTADVPVDTCIQFAATFGKKLPPPIHRDNTTRHYFSETIYVEMIQEEWQWTIGGTRIQSTCFGSIGADKNAIREISLILRFEPVSRSPELIATFLLRCTRLLTMAGRTEPRQVSDFVFWVSPGLGDNKPLIRNTRLSSIAEKDSIHIDNNQIIFTIKNSETLSTKYSIDRVSGQLQAESMEFDSKIGTATGICSKVESLRKF